jgi:hypothetical protein
VKELKESHSLTVKEKERLIKQAKSERDSLYEELKSMQSGNSNNQTLTRNTSKKQIVG